MSDNERKLASVRRIDKLEPIEGADKILKATVGGWELVTAKDNNFVEGQLIIYCEIDSWLPYELAPFLSKGNEPRKYNGVKGERLRSIKLRGQVSQGLILPLEPYFSAGGSHVTIENVGMLLEEGLDLTEMLGIQKWERPMTANLMGQARRYFPPFIRKTDQERCQNLKQEIADWFERGVEWEVTEKLDGSSMTVYANYTLNENDEGMSVDVGVCSRNLELKLEQEGNSFVNKAKDCGLLTAVYTYASAGYGELAVQGELYGEGIQGNNEKITGHSFAVFDIFDITRQKYLGSEERLKVVKELQELGANINHAPIHATNWKLETPNIHDLLVKAEGKNEAGNPREGIVFKSKCGQFSFKAISNSFLLKNGD